MMWFKRLLERERDIWISNPKKAVPPRRYLSVLRYAICLEQEVECLRAANEAFRLALGPRKPKVTGAQGDTDNDRS